MLVEGLERHGLEANLQPVDAVTAVDAYDAVVVGSAVYAGHWLRPARDFVDGHAAELRQLPVWSFSSGPVGDPAKPSEDAAEVAEFTTHLGVREHRVFAGKLDRSDLGLTEKALVKLVRAPEGDFRPWPDIAAWADSIAEALLEPVGRPA